MSTIEGSSQNVIHAVHTACNQSYTILDIQTYLQCELENDDMGPTKVHIDAIVASLHSTVDTLPTICADWLNLKWGGVEFYIEYFMDACDVVVHLINHIDDSDEDEPIIPGDTPAESAN